MTHIITRTISKKPAVNKRKIIHRFIEFRMAESRKLNRQAAKKQIRSNRIASAWHNWTDKNNPQLAKLYRIAAMSRGGQRRRILDKINRATNSARLAGAA